MNTENNPNTNAKVWAPGKAPVTVILLTLNEGHNMEAALKNLQGFAQQVFIVDSYSSDNTIDIALRFGVNIVQREFKNFGDQWNFALDHLPIKAPWTIKLDPDERINPTLKREIINKILTDDASGISFDLNLWFMGKPIGIKQNITRAWRTGKCRFSDVTVNEHPIIDGRVDNVGGELQHHDSPHLGHWLDKQNKYTSAEAIASYQRQKLSAPPVLFGTRLERRMWIKQNFMKIPFRYTALFFYLFIIQGAWRAGRTGYIWARLRCDVYRLWEYKLYEIHATKILPKVGHYQTGKPDNRIKQY